MATVNFSVPGNVKEKFNKAFMGKNKSQIIAGLMMRAVEEQEEQKRRVKAIDDLLKLRNKKVSFNDGQINAARKYGRP